MTTAKVRPKLPAGRYGMRILILFLPAYRAVAMTPVMPSGLTVCNSKALPCRVNVLLLLPMTLIDTMSRSEKVLRRGSSEIHSSPNAVRIHDHRDPSSDG